MSEIRHILAATDFSEGAALAEARAALLCAELNCDRLELLTVKDDRMPDALAGVMRTPREQALEALTLRAEQQLQPISSRLQADYGVRCALGVRFGPVVQEILARAEAMPADLTVVGAHGGNFVSDVFVGNTTDKLVRMSRRPVLIVRNEAKEAYRQVLVPVDFSEDSLCAAKLAMAIAPQAHIVLLHVFEVLFEGQMQFANVSTDAINEYRADARENARQEMERFVAPLLGGNPMLSHSLKLGRPATGIREQAATMGADLIVMGKHGKSRIEAMLFGSVTRDTIDRTSCDILVATAGGG